MRAQVGMAVVNIFLLLSVAPLNARRVSNVQAAIGGAHAQSGVRSFVEEMAEELANVDEQEAEQGTYIGEWWASCGDLKHDFERRARKTKSALSKHGANGHISTSNAVYAALKIRKVAKTYARAQEKGCKWPNHGEHVDNTPLKQIVQMSASSSPCFPKAESMIRNATMSGNFKGVLEAMTLVVSPECNAHKVKEGRAAAVPEKVGASHLNNLISDMDDAADKVEDLLEEEDASGVGGTSLVEAARAAFNSTRIAGKSEWAVVGTIALAIVGVVALVFLIVLACSLVVSTVMFMLSLMICMTFFLFIMLLGGTLGGCLNAILTSFKPENNENSNPFCRADLFANLDFDEKAKSVE